MYTHRYRRLCRSRRRPSRPRPCPRSPRLRMPIRLRRRFPSRHGRTPSRNGVPTLSTLPHFRLRLRLRLRRLSRPHLPWPLCPRLQIAMTAHVSLASPLRCPLRLGRLYRTRCRSSHLPCRRARVRHARLCLHRFLLPIRHRLRLSTHPPSACQPPLEPPHTFHHHAHPYQRRRRFRLRCLSPHLLCPLLPVPCSASTRTVIQADFHA